MISLIEYASEAGDVLVGVAELGFDVYVAVAGLVVGFAVGLTGMGGGALMTPILVLLFGVHPLAAVSSDLVASLIMKPVGAVVHAGRRTVSWSLVRWLSLGSVPGALCGVAFLKLLAKGVAVQTVVQYALGSVLLLSVAAMAARWLIQRRAGTRVTGTPDRAPDEAMTVRPMATALIGLTVGFIVGITATGSGTLIIVALLFMYPKLRASRTVGTDLTQAIPMVGAAALGHVLFGDFQLALTLSIVAGAIPGVLAGATLSSRSSTGWIRVALCLVLAVSGLKLLGVPTLVLGAVVLAGLLSATTALVLSRVPAVNTGSRVARLLKPVLLSHIRPDPHSRSATIRFGSDGPE